MKRLNALFLTALMLLTNLSGSYSQDQTQDVGPELYDMKSYTPYESDSRLLGCPLGKSITLDNVYGGPNKWKKMTLKINSAKFINASEVRKKNIYVLAGVNNYLKVNMTVTLNDYIGNSNASVESSIPFTFEESEGFYASEFKGALLDGIQGYNTKTKHVSGKYENKTIKQAGIQKKLILTGDIIVKKNLFGNLDRTSIRVTTSTEPYDAKAYVIDMDCIGNKAKTHKYGALDIGYFETRENLQNWSYGYYGTDGKLGQNFVLRGNNYTDDSGSIDIANIFVETYFDQDIGQKHYDDLSYQAIYNADEGDKIYDCNLKMYNENTKIVYGLVKKTDGRQSYGICAISKLEGGFKSITIYQELPLKVSMVFVKEIFESYMKLNFINGKWAGTGDPEKAFPYTGGTYGNSQLGKFTFNNALKEHIDSIDPEGAQSTYWTYNNDCRIILSRWINILHGGVEEMDPYASIDGYEPLVFTKNIGRFQKIYVQFSDVPSDYFKNFTLDIQLRNGTETLEYNARFDQGMWVEPNINAMADYMSSWGMPKSTIDIIIHKTRTYVGPQ